MPAYFAAASIATGLGADLPQQLAALREAPPRPRSLPCTLGQQSVEVPYLALQPSPPAAAQDYLLSLLDDTTQKALADADLDLAQRRRTGLFFATSSFNIRASEQAYEQELASSSQPLPMRWYQMGGLAADLATRLQLSEQQFTFNTACTSGANALLYADAMINAGLLDHALIVALELFNHTTAMGFHGLDLLSPGGMKPFDTNRDGLVLGETCAAMLLSREHRFADRPYLQGGANLCDTYSMSTANRDGTTVAAVMRQALHAAQVRSGDIRAIKAHGTASLSNDEAEAAGMHEVFDRLPPVTALKPFIGHTLGACGLAETILFCEALRAGFVIPVAGISAEPGDLNVRLNQAPVAASAGAYLLNYFGFGGNNTSLVVAHPGGAS